MLSKIRYRLALDLGSTSLGWAMLGLNGRGEPCAVIRAGVRIFSDGRNQKDGSSLAVTRRTARAMRRRRDRLLKRKHRVMQALIDLGFFPTDEAARKALERLNPYELRAKGLDFALTPAEFARAVFHLNQRRGFQSNRKTDKKESDSSALKAAIGSLQASLDPNGADGKARTVGEFLWQRIKPQKDGGPLRPGLVRARYRQIPVQKDDGKTRIDKSYDLYMDRAMVQAEFNALWAKQAEFNPTLYSETAKKELDYRLWHQRKLRPVQPGRCTLIPDEPRAPLALPSQQRFRTYQEVHNLRLLGENLFETTLTRDQRDKLVKALERGNLSFKTAIPKLLGLPSTVKFNLADDKRTELKGNETSIRLSKKDLFGADWHEFSESLQDEIVTQLLQEESKEKLVAWLQDKTGVDEQRADAIDEAAGSLRDGYGSLSAKALSLILPELRKDVVSFADAAKAAGFHHSRLSENVEVPGRTFKLEVINQETGELKDFHLFKELPYYGEFLQRHVGFADPRAKPDDLPEKRFGRIANPTVHIGLNQVRKVVNTLIQRYGHPTEVIVEVARDLKQNQEQKREEQTRQAKNKKRNDDLRKEAAGIRGCDPARVTHTDIQRLILWQELNPGDCMDRKCPYSGVQISKHMALSEETEIEHILPFSETLDDSLNNKTLSMRKANRIKGNRTPWQACEAFAMQGWSYDGILQRAEQMPRGKRYRFGEDGLQTWLREDKGFLARALNDTRYMSRVAREYLSLICPQATRVIPGQMTAMLRDKFGLNDILGLKGIKNRNDHRHHAIDACVIAVTDQALLQRFSRASADAREKQLDRLVENMPLPWETYREHVGRAVDNIWVSHKPDHGHEGEMFDATIYGLRGPGKATYRQEIDGQRVRPLLNREVVPFADQSEALVARHGSLPDGAPKPYMGLWSRSNYCIEIERERNGSWSGNVLERYRAYQIVAKRKSTASLRDRTTSTRGAPLAMRLLIDDTVLAEINGSKLLLKVLKINSTGAVTFVLHNETNISARYAAKLAAQKDFKAGKPYNEADLNDQFFQRSISPDALRGLKARQVRVSPIGDFIDPGFRE